MGDGPLIPEDRVGRMNARFATHISRGSNSICVATMATIRNNHSAQSLLKVWKYGGFSPAFYF
jgi:hypothetical protein